MCVCVCFISGGSSKHEAPVRPEHYRNYKEVDLQEAIRLALRLDEDKRGGSKSGKRKSKRYPKEWMKENDVTIEPDMRSVPTVEEGG